MQLSILFLLLGALVQATPLQLARRQEVVDAASSSSSDPTAVAELATDTAVPSVADAAAVSATPSAAEAPASSNADLTVVKFARLAESLESTFYDQALKKFSAQDFANAGFADGQAIFDSLGVVLKDEQTHLTVLQSVATSLGGSTSDVDSCTFNFDAALSDVPTFLATARVLEFVGVDAYIGGATLITDKALLVSAAEILTVEARHNTVLNLLNGGSSIPSAFDMVLTPQQVLSVAAPFISGGCDRVSALGLTRRWSSSEITNMSDGSATPALTVTNTDLVAPGTLVTFGGAGIEGKDTAALFCNMIVGGATEGIVFPVSQCVVPEGLDGPVHLFVTNSQTPLSKNIVNQDASIVVAGPAIAFIDTIPNTITAALKSGGAADQAQLQVAAPGDAAGAAGHGSSSEGGGKTVVITKTIITKIRHERGEGGVESE